MSWSSVIRSSPAAQTSLTNPASATPGGRSSATPPAGSSQTEAGSSQPPGPANRTAARTADRAEAAGDAEAQLGILSASSKKYSIRCQ
jgi:hypothetical protein